MWTATAVDAWEEPRANGKWTAQHYNKRPNRIRMINRKCIGCIAFNTDQWNNDFQP